MRQTAHSIVQYWVGQLRQWGLLGRGRLAPAPVAGRRSGPRTCRLGRGVLLTCHKTHATSILVVFRIEQALSLRHRGVFAHNLGRAAWVRQELGPGRQRRRQQKVGGERFARDRSVRIKLHPACARTSRCFCKSVPTQAPDLSMRTPAPPSLQDSVFAPVACCLAQHAAARSAEPGCGWHSDALPAPSSGRHTGDRVQAWRPAEGSEQPLSAPGQEPCEPPRLERGFCTKDPLTACTAAENLSAGGTSTRTHVLPSCSLLCAASLAEGSHVNHVIAFKVRADRLRFQPKVSRWTQTAPWQARRPRVGLFLRHHRAHSAYPLHAWLGTGRTNGVLAAGIAEFAQHCWLPLRHPRGSAAFRTESPAARLHGRSPCSCCWTSSLHCHRGFECIHARTGAEEKHKHVASQQASRGIASRVSLKE